MEWTRNNYQLTDDKGRLDTGAVGSLLSTTYWAHDRPPAAMETAIRNSVCLGMFYEGQQMGFCRAVTDYATFTWICDVIIHPDHRGRGLGKWMVECLIHHPLLQTRSQVLATRDAHGLYERYGFKREEYLKRRKETGITEPGTA
jgi:GNAT superfamily N-acetyltransferase